MTSPDRESRGPAYAAWTEDDSRTIQYYSALIQQYGRDPRALDWGGEESQRLRFSVLADIGSLEGASVLDIGCGQGDFYRWFLDAGIRVDYRGIDITPGMIDIARARFPEAEFEVGNILEAPPAETYDYVFASGIFYLRRVEALTFLHRVAGAMLRCCRKGAAFNSLSSWAPQQETGEFYADPLEVLRFCHTLTPRLSLRHDYHARDFSVFLYK